MNKNITDARGRKPNLDVLTARRQLSFQLLDIHIVFANFARYSSFYSFFCKVFEQKPSYCFKNTMILPSFHNVVRQTQQWNKVKHFMICRQPFYVYSHISGSRIYEDMILVFWVLLTGPINADVVCFRRLNAYWLNLFNNLKADSCCLTL